MTSIFLPDHIIHNFPVAPEMSFKQQSECEMASPMPDPRAKKPIGIEDDSATIHTKEEAAERKEGRGIGIRPSITTEVGDSVYKRQTMAAVHVVDTLGSKLFEDARRAEFKEKIMTAYARAAARRGVIAIAGTMCSRGAELGNPEEKMEDVAIPGF